MDWPDVQVVSIIISWHLQLNSYFFIMLIFYGAAMIILCMYM